MEGEESTKKGKLEKFITSAGGTGRGVTRKLNKGRLGRRKSRRGRAIFRPLRGGKSSRDSRGGTVN